ncbi:MAG TPA: hypothetical protein VGE66_02765 [Chitinophagaceae bacterium]
MSNFTRTITLALLSTVLFACSKPEDPREVSVSFIEHLHARQFDEAAALATPGSKATVEALKTEAPAATPAINGKEPVQAVFGTDALQPYISGNSAIVKNNLVSLNLEKVDGEWQVVATKELVDDIMHRAERNASVKASWEALKNEYVSRSVLLREYINYVRSSGKASAEVVALEEALKKLPTIGAAPTKEDIVGYVKGQAALNTLADKAMQPTLTASADLTMNYIISMQSQESKIAEAKTAYNTVAAGAHSPVYVVVP